MGGENLNIDMLTDSNEADFSINLDELSQQQSVEKKPTEEQDNKKDTSEEDINSLESVAGEKDKGGASASSQSSSPSSDGNNLSKLYSSLATHFHEAGVLPSLNLEETKIESKEDLEKAIKAEIENGMEENVKAYRQAMERGEPQDAYVAYQQQKAQLDRITDDVLTHNDNAQLRVNVIAKDFMNRGFTQEESLKYAQRSQDLGEDIEDAKNALNRIKAFNDQSYQDTVKAKLDADTAKTNEIKSFVNNNAELIKGIKMTDGVKNNLIKQMTTAVGRDENGNAVTEYGKAMTQKPVETKVMTEYLFMLTKGFTDFSSLGNSFKSKAVSEVDEVLRNSGGNFLGGLNPKHSEETFSIGDEFKLDI